MKRGLFNIASGISLLLCLVVAIMWFNSYWSLETWEWHVVDPANKIPNDEFGLSPLLQSKSVSVYWGRVEFQSVSWDHVDLPAGQSIATWPGHPGNPERWPLSLREFWNTLMNFGVHETNHPGFKSWTIWCPLWPAILIFGGLPTIWGVRFSKRCRRENRRALGLCPECGYDLRGSPGSCPECGWSNSKTGGLVKEPTRSPS